ncbi:MAG: cobaltochelatase subunit CobN [Methanolobus sp.]|uniref:cobaltochelatase subunit CobN n=1 Tax=Methanolobus sp. TaxID=1874737 RepID=UPI00272F62B6|nr:cobaltochelatase subunit CobN [Methanolobus sp.]MDP2217701.1 cobaltochelatase subunit CobN [Methanolobus sp.]
MQLKIKPILVLSILLLVSLTGVAAADEQKIKILYVAYSPNNALEMASQTCVYSDLIEYAYIPGYNTTTWGASDELLAAAQSGLLLDQDIIFCDMLSSNVYTETNDSFHQAHENGISVLSIRSSGTPSYFNYVSDGKQDDAICNYYNNMGISGKGLENAENLLIYLAKEYGNHSEITSTWGTTASNSDEFLFILGTDFNKNALITAASAADISLQLNATILSTDEVHDDFNFSKYGVIFIESQDEILVNDTWENSINAARSAGAKVIGYNLSEKITLTNIDLYSDEYTDIERFWIQGGEANMANMLRVMGQKFAGLWTNKAYTPEIVHPKVNVTYIINSDSSLYYMNLVISQRDVITDRFNVKVMSGQEAINSSVDLSDEDVVILYMVGANEFPLLKDDLIAAKDNGGQIGMFGMLPDSYGITTFDMLNPPHSAMTTYLYNSGYENMENWIRCVGATLEDVYIQYAPAAPPSIPDDGIYHPEAFPRIFDNSAEYLEWYADHGYNPSAPTIGIIGGRLGKTTRDYNTEDTLIRNIESKGYNVIYTTYKVCEADVDYITMDGEVLVDSLISLKGFYLNYNDHEKGVEYLKDYNVPVIKGIMDYYYTPDQYIAGLHGLSPTSIPYQVTQPEIDGLTDYIWIAGRVKDPVTGQYYYEPIDEQVDWICDRAIAWAELGKKENADKKISVIYYNHEGGKNNIGASYLDIGSSFTILLDQMRAVGYDIGNGDIPTGGEFIELFITSRNVGTWAPGELEKVVDSGMVTMMPVDEYLTWYNTLPASVRDHVESRWGEAPGNVMVYENASGKYFVIPTIQMGNVNFIPQPTRAGLSDESIIYHDKELPPTHQYLATYFWINNVYDADAMIHFGTHGTQEWLPGKEVGLWRYDYPSIMVAETPVIYPYIMDNVGEGTQAKRRGNAVIIDHLTPAITEAGLYGELAEIHEKIHNYKDAKSKSETAMMALYRNRTIELYDSISLEDDLEVTSAELQAMTDDEFEYFLDAVLHDYLHELQSTLMPLGLHIFGVAPQDNKLVNMVKSMLGNTLTENIFNVLPKTEGGEENWDDEEDWENQADAYALDILNSTILNGTNVSDAQYDILGQEYENITANLNTALVYADNLGRTTQEIGQTLRALNAEYIEPGPGNDPIRNPEALPTGRNFYSFDQRAFPDPETEAMGVILAEQMLKAYQSEHNGTYPNKVSYILWSVETMRHRGLMEAQIYAMLGVKPTRSSGRITGFTVVPQEEMTHPRIDVLLIPSGLYRDTFPYQLELMDTAIRQVAELNESNETNYVRWNSLKIEQALLESGYNESTAHYVSQSRIFSEAPGTYGTGMSEAAAASNTWEDDSVLAELFISRMSNIYGKDAWGVSYETVFRMNLMDVDAAIHSDSSNLYGLIDNDDYYSYLGGLALAVRSLTGENPSMYVADLKSTANPQVVTLSEAFRNELRARYLNPSWISGMMEYDYAGAREMMKFVEYMWGWDAMTPDLVKDSDWNQIYDVYVTDKYDLGLDEYFKDNPYQYQSMTGRMLETTRKLDSEGNPYWYASDEVIQSLVKEYVESVVASGVTCCHHTCGNPLLDNYVRSVMTTTGVVDVSTAKEYERLMQEATKRESTPVTEESTTRKSSSSTGTDLKVVESGSGSTNQTMMSESGAGMDTNTPVQDSAMSTPDNYIEGYEMTKESVTQPDSSGPSFSGSDIIASVLVLAAVGAIYMGFWKRRKM